MQPDAIAEAVVRTVAAVLELPPAQVHDASREQLGNWDSLKHMEILFAVEDVLGVRFAEHELAQLDSVPKLIDGAVRHLAA